MRRRIIVELAEPPAVLGDGSVAVAEQGRLDVLLVFPNGDVLLHLVDDFSDHAVGKHVELRGNVARLGKGEAQLQPGRSDRGDGAEHGGLQLAGEGLRGHAGPAVARDQVNGLRFGEIDVSLIINGWCKCGQLGLPAMAVQGDLGLGHRQGTMHGDEVGDVHPILARFLDR